jgi:integrase
MQRDEFAGYRSAIKKVAAPPNTPTREKTVLTEDQLERLLSELVAAGRYQIACVVALAAFSGARKSELTRFKLCYFDDANIIHGSLYRTPEKIRTKGRGVKGKPLYKFVLANRFKPYLELWRGERERLGIDSEWLFVAKTPDGYEQAKPGTLNAWADVNSEVLGIPFYFHCLRHFFTSHLSKSGLPDSVIQQIVGWDSADMVKIYNDNSIEDQLSKYFDDNGIRATKTEVGDLN